MIYKGWNWISQLEFFLFSGTTTTTAPILTIKACSETALRCSVHQFPHLRCGRGDVGIISGAEGGA